MPSTADSQNCQPASRSIQDVFRAQRQHSPFSDPNLRTLLEAGLAELAGYMGWNLSHEVQIACHVQAGAVELDRCASNQNRNLAPGGVEPLKPGCKRRCPLWALRQQEKWCELSSPAVHNSEIVSRPRPAFLSRHEGQRRHRRPGQEGSGSALLPGAVAVAEVRRRRVAALAAGHVEVASWPGGTARRSEAPLSQPLRQDSSRVDP